MAGSKQQRQRRRPDGHDDWRRTELRDAEEEGVEHRIGKGVKKRRRYRVEPDGLLFAHVVGDCKQQTNATQDRSDAQGNEDQAATRSRPRWQMHTRIVLAPHTNAASWVTRPSGPESVLRSLDVDLAYKFRGSGRLRSRRKGGGWAQAL